MSLLFTTCFLRRDLCLIFDSSPSFLVIMICISFPIIPLHVCTKIPKGILAAKGNGHFLSFMPLIKQQHLALVMLPLGGFALTPPILHFPLLSVTLMSFGRSSFSVLPPSPLNAGVLHGAHLDLCILLLLTLTQYRQLLPWPLLPWVPILCLWTRTFSWTADPKGHITVISPRTSKSTCSKPKLSLPSPYPCLPLYLLVLPP